MFAMCAFQESSMHAAQFWFVGKDGEMRAGQNPLWPAWLASGALNLRPQFLGGARASRRTSGAARLQFRRPTTRARNLLTKED